MAKQKKSSLKKGKTDKKIKAKTTKTVKAKARAVAKVGAKKVKPKKVKSKKSLMGKTKSAPQKVSVASRTVTPKDRKNKLSLVPAQFQPLGHRVFIRVLELPQQTAGGLVIPATVEERPNRGVVEAIGSGRRGRKGAVRPLDVQPGDTVLFSTYAGTPVELGHDNYLVLEEDQILGVVES